MLGSSFDGERANAARLATDLLERHGLTWREVLAPPLPPPAYKPQRAPEPSEPEPATKGDAFWAAEHAEVLNQWERDFLQSIMAWRGDLTRRQRDVLTRIVAKVRAAQRARQ
jgi:hypothetical protein